MGCDVHMYVEYVHKSDLKRYEKDLLRDSSQDRKVSLYINSFGGKINPGRNYLMFGCLAKGTRVDVAEAIPPKGLPEFLSYTCESDNLVFITENGDGDNECTLEDAISWEKYGKKIIYYNDKPTYVEHPDWHSHTWLTLKEYKNALELFKANSQLGEKIPIQYTMILDLMKSIKRNGAIPRLVMWFDN